jgi:tetratricopeptide (TPR) repeat protein
MTTRIKVTGIAPERIARCCSKAVVVLLAGFLVYSAPVILPLETDGMALAQDEKKKDKDRPMSGKKSQAMSAKVAEKINEANDLVNVEDYTGAMKILDQVKVMPKLSDYETAQLYSFYGYLYFNSEQYKKAIGAYEMVLKQPEINEGILQQTIRTLSQLAFVTEDYQAAINYANQYLEMVGPDSDMYVVIGTAYYQIAAEKQNPTKADFGKVIPPVEKAIALAEEAGKDLKENWLLLLRVAYWEQDNFKKVKEILEQLVVGWPKKEYWTQLSAIYFELKDEPRQLAAYEAAYDQKLLVSSAELVQMAQLFMQADVPYKGARVLEKGFEAEIVERKVSNLRLFSQAWQMASEDRKAIPPLKEAAGMSDDGELFARLAQSHLNLSDYGECISASDKALAKGGLKNTGNAYLILGMCQFESDKLGSSKATFRKALKYEKSAKTAGSWIAFVESEESRLRQLKESLRRASQPLGGQPEGVQPEEAEAAAAAEEDAQA